MSEMFSKNDKIGDIVTKFPGASDIFYKYRIDFCCGGNRPLSAAIEEQNVDEQEVLEAVNNKYTEFKEKNSEFTDWAKESPSRLIDYIINKHHAYLREKLPQLGDYVLKIMKVHGQNHEELFKVHKLFNHLRTELEGHLVKEEELVFPLIKEYEKTKDEKVRDKALKLIKELEDEHTGAGDVIKELREVTDHYHIPADACRTFETAYNGLKEIETDLFQHIHLENNILFPNF
ncbi:MAG: iron-sulfur cluster repair di-iron protein [Clostridia bacterium]|nr:iron-sulfur cluster repair di-iron protein [Clostridia bacterium]